MFNVAVSKDWCAAVPESWTNNNDKICLWPSRNINITNAIKKLSKPQPSWKKISIKYILGPYGIHIHINNTIIFSYLLLFFIIYYFYYLLFYVC